MSRPGRNDPCYCGSGKKYKQCHLRADLEEERLQREQGRAARFLRLELPRFAREERFREAFDEALAFYWNGYYGASNAHAMSELEALRFLDWFVFERKLPDGERIIDVYAAEHGDTLTAQQTTLLQSWQKAPAASAYELVDYDGQQLRLRNVFSGEDVTVFEAGGRGHVEIGEYILARPVPVFERNEFSTVAAYLPGDESDGLLPYVEAVHREQDGETGARTTAGFIEDNSHLIIHYALLKAEEAGRPPVARLDKNRSDPPIQHEGHEFEVEERVHRQRTYGSTQPHLAQTRRKAV